MNKYDEKIKRSVIECFSKGETVLQISKATGISRPTIYSWVKECENKSEHKVNMGDYRKLQSHCKKLENMITILKTCGCAVHEPLRKKYEVISDLSDKYSVATLCDALDVPKGSYYNYLLRNKNENIINADRRKKFREIIEEIYFDSKEIYGAGKIHAILKDRGYNVSKRTVTSIMQENGWFAIRNGAKKIYLKMNRERENILNQNFKTSRPNEVWVSDVTYFKYNHKTYYICIVMDLYARKVISCKISLKNSTQLTKATFKKAYYLREPQDELLFHSDRGSNYVSKNFMDYLQELGVMQSFSKGGNPYDNSVMEAFFKTMKAEELYRMNYHSEKEFKKAVYDYIQFYNEKRPHTVLNYKTPDQTEKSYYELKAKV